MSAQVETRRKAATASAIDSTDRAKVLAEHLLDPKRSKPVVVITVAAGQPGPYIDAEAIVDAVNELAEVYLLPTGRITFALSDRLPERTQVYGGAGRVYPVDSTWQSDPYAAPLRFAFGAAQGPVATDRLIADALGAVHAAGLSTKRAGATVQQVEGKVEALLAGSRAWVRTVAGGDATIWQDLLFPGIPIDRAFQVGMQISGSLDVEQCRIDVSASLRKSGDALAGYAVGAVVLGRVLTLDNIAAIVEIYPGVRIGMSATEVTGNPIDHLTTLMSVDEVLPVRVVARGGHDGRGWRLSMLDVEDSEPILASPSLLPSGPPWLVMADVAPEISTAVPRIEPVERIGPKEQTEQLEGPLVFAEPEAPMVAAPLPHPAIESRVTNGGEVPKLFPLAVDDSGFLRRQIAELEGQLLRSRTSAQAVQIERDAFRGQTSELHARVQRLQLSAKKARTDLRNEKQKSQQLVKQLKSAKAEGNEDSNGSLLFKDPEKQFRFDVDVAYAHRISAEDKEIRPLRELRLGPDFLTSLTSIEGIDRGKVFDVVADILTDLVTELGSRDLHPLREGKGSAARDVIRHSDGARCMRVALQRRTPSARRLHYWKVGDTIELSRVVKHDDMTP